MKGKLNRSSSQTPELLGTHGGSQVTTETSNKLNEFWTGKTTFKVLANAEVIDEGGKHRVNQGVITRGTHCSVLHTIHVANVFIPYKYRIEISKHEVDHPTQCPLSSEEAKTTRLWSFTLQNQLVIPSRQNFRDFPLPST